MNKLRGALQGDSRRNEVIKGPGNVLIVVLHIHPSSVDGHGLHLLFRQQLPADALPLLTDHHVGLSLLQVVPELALVVGQRLKKRTGSPVQGVRLILNAAGRRNCGKEACLTAHVGSVTGTVISMQTFTDS